MKRRLHILVISSSLATPLMSSCTPNSRIVGSSRTPEPVNSTPVASSFETDLQSMRTADFKFILVFRRKDGGIMNAEDKSFVNANTPPDANRKKLSDGERAIVIGSNFPFVPGSITNLTERFNMEDFSIPDAGPLEVDRSPIANTSPKANK